MTGDNILYDIAIWLVPLVVAIVFHEVAHGVVANHFGDPTAADQGRLTFNPLRHVDPVGTVLLPLVLAITHAPIFGWARPVPVRAERLRNPRVHMMLVALAGPGMNLLLAVAAAMLVALLLGGSGQEPQGAAAFLTDNLVNFLLINVFLAIFNLLPVPPFDGGHVVEGLLPRPWAAQYARLGRFAFPILVVLLLVVPLLFPQANVVARVVSPIATFVATGLLWLVGLGA
ncbi:site-2 protease family protein [Stakelama saccharophila]|uniref:Site-2 protease family protein n=1 Tax=Stakelama saccharophila TaxID=3075605 RepID=A0ABZ0BA11_9SPHN|nr:site-2 protease family protein [Stakelama sp. W311]WNO53920.1 site-2 protease family protein [Stakelama sp. W311]